MQRHRFWTRPVEGKDVYWYHTPEGDRDTSNAPNRLQGRLIVGEKLILPDQRGLVIERVNSVIRASWINGGLVFTLYQCSARGNHFPSIVQPIDVVAVLRDLASIRSLPPEIAGCSVDVLADQGVWRETPSQFGTAIFRALCAGGAYISGIDFDQGEGLTGEYLTALFADAPEDQLALFGLDLRFSSWFHALRWDFAYAIVNAYEGWFGLVLATDID